MKLTFTVKPLKIGQIHSINGRKYEVLDIKKLSHYSPVRWLVELRRCK